MNPNISEKSFEEAIENTLLANGPDAPGGASWSRESLAAYGSEWIPGGYRKRRAEEYDRALCLVPRDVFDFILATQPKEWQKLETHYGSETKDRFLKRLAREIEQRGTLDVLRKGIKDAGCKFSLLYFRPASSLNKDLAYLYQANIFSVIRQLHYSERHEKSLDLALFVNGIPLFTGELKNPLTGQTVEDAIRQYRFDRDPRDPLLQFRRCLAHFAVDPDLIYIATRLEGSKTRFLPFNQGKYGGAGNPPVPPTQDGYSTSYLWESILARDSILDLIQHFIQEVEDEDENGRKTGGMHLLFPRYHQLDTVRRLVRDAKAKGVGQHYLIQHSAGSGKSNSISWLAHQLSILHDAKDNRVFDSIIVITDRRVLDRQLQRNVQQFEQIEGLVENIDKTSRQLKEALEAGKTIIVSTLQKFPVIADQIQALPGKRFAVIIDEAHSSQTGESTKGLKAVLSAGSLEEAEKEDKEEIEDLEDRIVEEMKKRGRPANTSYFAFTATPKPKTLELFGIKRPDNKFEAFSLYSMRQAIEEGFILDVLENYTTYRTYWRLLKTAKDDPHYDRNKASYILQSFVEKNEHAIRKKVEIMVEHFHDQVSSRIGGLAKAMIVTRSRLHAVRCKLAIDAYLHEKAYPYKSLVAFSGKVVDGGVNFTETSMNSTSQERIPETQTARTFHRPEYRFMVVAEKFQTGFDEPLLHTMYVDKRLNGLNAVQTLSRLNRVHPGKIETMVLDFVNDADEIQKAFEPYYEKTLLSEETDPALLYDLERQLKEFHVFSQQDMENFAKLYFIPNTSQDKLYAALRPIVERVEQLQKEERMDLRGKLTDYVRLYAFLSQLLTFTDADLEKLYVFARLLKRYYPREQNDFPRDIQEQINIESYRVQRTHTGKITLERGQKEVKPIGADGRHVFPVEEIEPLSRIIRELNERFGTDFTNEDKVFIQQLEERLAGDQALADSIKVNTSDNARLTFDYVVNDRLQEMVDTNFKFYKRITDDQQFGKFFLDWLFERLKQRTQE